MVPYRFLIYSLIIIGVINIDANEICENENNLLITYLSPTYHLLKYAAESEVTFSRTLLVRIVAKRKMIAFCAKPRLISLRSNDYCCAILPDSSRSDCGKKKRDQKWVSSSFWSHFPDSNRGPTHYECVALPTEPKWRKRVQKYCFFLNCANFL